jgi:hypothetical protein
LGPQYNAVGKAEENLVIVLVLPLVQGLRLPEVNESSASYICWVNSLLLRQLETELTVKKVAQVFVRLLRNFILNLHPADRSLRNSGLRHRLSSTLTIIAPTLRVVNMFSQNAMYRYGLIARIKAQSSATSCFYYQLR